MTGYLRNSWVPVISMEDALSAGYVSLERLSEMVGMGVETTRSRLFRKKYDGDTCYASVTPERGQPARMYKPNSELIAVFRKPARERTPSRKLTARNGATIMSAETALASGYVPINQLSNIVGITEINLRTRITRTGYAKILPFVVSVLCFRNAGRRRHYYRPDAELIAMLGAEYHPVNWCITKKKKKPVKEIPVFRSAEPIKPPKRPAWRFQIDGFTGELTYADALDDEEEIALPIG